MPPKKHQHLTPEERKALKVQKRNERKFRLAEQKKQQKRDHLEREVKYGDYNLKKYERSWREMLIKIAVPRMREELEFAWHNFERVADCKDFTISLLLDDLRNSEEQYMLNFRTHAENLEKLLGIFHDRLNELNRDFQLEGKNMEDRCESEVQTTKEVANENFEYLKTMMYQLEVARKEHNRMKKGEYVARLDEVDTTKHQLLLQKMKVNIENKYNRTFEDIGQFTKNYHQQIKDRKKEHNLLKDQDDSIQELIAQQFKQMRKCYDKIRLLKQNYIEMKQTIGNKSADLDAERQYFSNSFLSLKNKLENDKKDDFDKLAQLSASCAEAFDYLENLVKKGETILNLATVCRKLETLQEKILPVPINKQDVDKDEQREEKHVEQIEGVRPEMELFWQRLGQAFGVSYTLKREKKFLTEENQLLIDTHNEYCQKLMYPPVYAYRETSTIPKIDANFEMNKYKESGKSHRRFAYREWNSGLPNSKTSLL